MKRIATILAVLVLLALPASPQNNVTRFNYAHIAGAANTLIAAKPSELHTVVVNVAGTSFSIVDSTSATCSGGTAVSTAAAPTTGQTLAYDVLTSNGLCITTVGAATDITVSWR